MSAARACLKSFPLAPPRLLLLPSSLLHSSSSTAPLASLLNSDPILSSPSTSPKPPQHERPGRVSGFSQSLRLFAAGWVLGAAGLATLGSDAYSLKEAHCEGVASLAADSPLPSLFVQFATHLLENVSLLSDSIRRRVFFTYERRIRAHSSPEKVFEYFASTKDSKRQYFMTAADLMRATVPVFPPSESSVVRGGFLVGEKPPRELHCSPSRLFMLFDTNADGRISFLEYYLFTTMLITSEESFNVTFKMFDRDGNGTIDLNEFLKVMELMRTRNMQGVAQNGARCTTINPPLCGLLEYFFGKLGDELLQFNKFARFMEDLHEEIIRLEFSHYDCKQLGSIPVRDFGSAMVAAASLSSINQYLDRVDALGADPNFRDARIYYKDFQEFAKLRKRRRQLASAAYAVGGTHGFSKPDFRHAALQVCEVELSDTAVDVIFHVFDTNRDGKLSLNEFLGVQDKRETCLANPTEPGIAYFMRCMWNCAKNCPSTGTCW